MIFHSYVTVDQRVIHHFVTIKPPFVTIKSPFITMKPPKSGDFSHDVPLKPEASSAQSPARARSEIFRAAARLGAALREGRGGEFEGKPPVHRRSIAQPGNSRRKHARNSRRWQQGAIPSRSELRSNSKEIMEYHGIIGNIDNDFWEYTLPSPMKNVLPCRSPWISRN